MIVGYTAAQVRAAEQPLLDAGPPGALMHQAAFGLAVRVARLLTDRRGGVRGADVVALVGPGNNGGDALLAGAELARRGAGVTVVATSAAVHDGGLAALRAAGGTLLTVVDGGPGRRVWVGDALAEAVSADVVVDGLLGIGARGAVRAEAAELVTLLAELLAQDVAPAVPDVVAVDVPSGIGVDDGDLPGPVLPADLTVTFGAVKAGLLLPPAAGLAGDVELVDLGLDLTGSTPAAARLEVSDVADLWPVPAAASHKYTRGVVGVVAGTALYPGAAVLATTAAVLSGAGMVRYVGPAAVGHAVLAARPEVVVGHGRVQAWVAGPGVDPADAEQTGRVRDVLAEALAAGLPVVADAGALGHLPDHLSPWVVLTPHAGELATLLSVRGEEVDRERVEVDPVLWARRAQRVTGATVLLKGPTTVVVGAGGAVWAQSDGPAWLATAGSGDVLAGLLGTLLAGCADEVLEDPPLVAALAAAAALVHGRAAHRSNPGGPVHALGVAHALPGTVADLLRG
ncbi:bifunctional ADP-dependent NAD(P)H-hydrate dehydratase/NAD(P)H-hydrate epimerase [Cellulomonas aerilata]|uniref:Bifunctional NAD(P)H-hydrate repair enzyme n=1 Tax=Cellulomonas aerilata TaxID=515326 RepID=A0A512D8V7_9CELL|nr:bifunctional ADP-dependent NAD(P)H-hydrate dehydratase/NAD(P)H-hydrate epimerase [Cellulomonas aerilata]GEO32918.1 carbohydrate kinase [Cellulomonas aerilata]